MINSLFLRRFLTSFWEPLGSHLRTFGSHLAAKGRLKTNLVFLCVLLTIVEQFLRGPALSLIWYLQVETCFRYFRKNVVFFVRACPPFGTLVDPNLAQMGAGGSQKHLSENTSKKIYKTTPKNNLS